MNATTGTAEKWASLVAAGRDRESPRTCDVYLVDSEDHYCDSYASVEEAVADLMGYWNEEPTGPQVFLVRGRTTRAVLAMLTRPEPESDPEVCLVRGEGIPLQAVRCRYVMGGDGMYSHTDILAV
jgi:hypothetical protein